ncbi:acetyl-CoA carboxylase, carboxyltransferase subunit beta [Rubripirellula amarantea]|uniref:Acetyl-coenzyme A carboxylase carboxyl transferase subunit beta n=1 Tax=Rubripirellula amarantea TaxID=2527999 RepID=A0A5C5WWX3_9BACT|nr:acetyl-CoA carboxylase, carboxyltransferase subunit beta [Rubripirellula amarantea]MDA8744900.1 acetyl-CoA carboxylase, carboxyltransferase subunit beta [Rubripirellula amarantea]TWT54729.1 Acetyl-coenzyme A carboxylase carboxyl transferase subunit beta [Rubripirellula amarantea]
MSTVDSDSSDRASLTPPAGASAPSGEAVSGSVAARNAASAAANSGSASQGDDTQVVAPKKRGVPEGKWVRCPGCGSTVYKKAVEQNLNVCPKCEHHFYVSAKERIIQVLDDGTFEPMNEHLRPTDPLEFSDRRKYADRLIGEQKRTGLTDAALTGTGMIRARRVAIAITDSAFIMGSMGSVVGERLARLIEHATTQNLPLIIISASGGGARMHEGILSLMQMAKVSAALARYDEAGGLFISVLTNPTMGGVAASFASLGDLVFAEPKALIGFAGPRTIKATIGIELPEGFQTSEFLLEHGYIDRIVPRKNLKTEIARTIDYCGK